MSLTRYCDIAFFYYDQIMCLQGQIKWKWISFRICLEIYSGLYALIFMDSVELENVQRYMVEYILATVTIR